MGRNTTQANAALALAFAAVTLVAVLDIIFVGRAILISFVIVGPLLAATAVSPRKTALVAGYAILVAVVLGWPDKIAGEVDHFVRLGVVAVADGLAIWAAAVRADREEAMRRMAHVAEVAQRAILRPPPPVLGPVAFAARYMSAAEEALIGGDLYETAYTPHGVRVILGDVRGKGLDAVGLAATVLGRFREVVFASPALVDVAVSIDRYVTELAAPEEFVTAVLVEFPDDGGVRVVNCGHHPPLRVGRGGAEFLVPCQRDLPFGLGPSFVLDEFPLDDGERMLLYTDGLVEARDTMGRFFALDDEVEALRVGDLDAAVAGLVDRVVEHAGGELNDDMAVLLTERRAPAP